MKLSIFLYITVFCTMCVLTNSAHSESVAKRTYIVSMGASLEDTSLYNRMERLLTEISKLSEIQFKFKVLSPSRGDEYFGNKKVDAIVAKIKNFQERHPDAIIVNEPFGVVDYYIYSHEPKLKIKTLDDLKRYKVVAVRGSSINVYLDNAKSLALLNNNEAVLKFLYAKRADCFLSSDIILRNQSKNLNYIVDSLYKSEEALMSEKHYTFFQAGLEDVAKSYEKALKETKANGAYNRIIYDGVLD